MNVMNPEMSESMLLSLKEGEIQSRSVVADKGETLVIEGRYVSVDGNNQVFSPAPVLTVPSWLVGQYAWRCGDADGSNFLALDMEFCFTNLALFSLVFFALLLIGWVGRRSHPLKTKQLVDHSVYKAPYRT